MKTYKSWISHRTITLDGRLHHAVIYWLEDRIGPNRSIFNPTGDWWYFYRQGGDGSGYLVFEFKDRAIAMMFKLTWG